MNFLTDNEDMALGLAVVGSRDFTDRDLACAWIDRVHLELGPFDLIISGGARGADAIAEIWAKRNDIKMKVYLADWSKHGKRAGYIRNVDIIESSDFVIAFWDGKSRGTAHSIKISQTANKPLLVIDTTIGEINKEMSTVNI